MDVSARSKQRLAAAAVSVLAGGLLLAASSAGSVGYGASVTSAQAAAKTPITIGIITTMTGALGPYGQEWKRGFQIGLQYATHGTDKVDGRQLEWSFKDDGGDPNVAVQEARSYLENQHVDILAGGVNSASAIAVEPLAAKYKTIFMVGPAVADSITGQYYNPYVFKVSPNSYMEAKAAVEVIGKKGATVAQLAPNYSFGWDSVSAFKQLAQKAGMKDVLDVYADPTATDFTPQLEKILQVHPQYLFVTWAGAPGPWAQIGQMKIAQQGITIDTGIPNIAAIQALFQQDVGMKGFTTYYYTLPHNPINNFLIKEDKAEYNTVPDLFDPDGMAAAIALVDGLNKTHGVATGSVLEKALSGMSFEGPKGKYTFRAQDHQAMQNLYAVVMKHVAGVNYPVPTLLKVLPANTLIPPILNGKG